MGITDSEGTQTSNSSLTTTNFREVVLQPQIAQGVAIIPEWLIEARFFASIKLRWGHFPIECKKPRQINNTSYDVSQKKKIGKAYLAEGKSWDDSDSDDEEVGNFALMAIYQTTVYIQSPI